MLGASWTPGSLGFATRLGRSYPLTVDEKIDSAGRRLRGAAKPVTGTVCSGRGTRKPTIALPPADDFALKSTELEPTTPLALASPARPRFGAFVTEPSADRWQSATATGVTFHWGQRDAAAVRDSAYRLQ